MPHIRSLGDKLWEMRLRDAGGIARAIYFTTSGERIVVLHAFEKRTQRTPRWSLDLAKRRMQEFLGSDTKLRRSESRTSTRPSGANRVRRAPRSLRSGTSLSERGCGPACHKSSSRVE